MMREWKMRKKNISFYDMKIRDPFEMNFFK